MRLEPGISGLTAVMAGGDAVEVKAQITADVLVLKPVCEQTVLSVAEEPLDTERLEKNSGDHRICGEAWGTVSGRSPGCSTQA